MKNSSFADDRYIDPIDRYESLSLKQSLSKPSRFIFACKELSFLLKNGYSKFPKNLQSLLFHDTLFAFCLLPQMDMQSAILAANSLLQSAEFALPKQKRSLAVKEHKHAVVAAKRKSKTNKENEGMVRLPQDVLVHIFSFLDVQSVLSASAACRSWNAAASDNHLWKLFYNTYFCDSHKKSGLKNGGGTDCRFVFEEAYKEARCRRLRSYRGYCWSCRSIVWLNSNKCSNKTDTEGNDDHQIKPISMQQIVEFILEGFVSSSDSSSDSDTEDAPVVGLWAYPKQIR